MKPPLLKMIQDQAVPSYQIYLFNVPKCLFFCEQFSVFCLQSQGLLLYYYSDETCKHQMTVILLSLKHSMFTSALKLTLVLL